MRYEPNDLQAFKDFNQVKSAGQKRALYTLLFQIDQPRSKPSIEPVSRLMLGLEKTDEAFRLENGAMQCSPA